MRNNRNYSEFGIIPASNAFVAPQLVRENPDDPCTDRVTERINAAHALSVFLLRFRRCRESFPRCIYVSATRVS